MARPIREKLPLLADMVQAADIGDLSKPALYYVMEGIRDLDFDPLSAFDPMEGML